MPNLLTFRKIAGCAALFLSLHLSLLALPSITRLSPYAGDTAGGTQVTIKGKDLSLATAVFFGDAPGRILSKSKHQIVAESPPHVPSTLHVLVVDPSGTSIPTEADYFVYQGNWRAYATNGDTSSMNLAYIDVKTLTTSPPLSVGSAPSSILCTSDGTRIFTINYDSNNVTVVDTNNSRVIDTISVGNSPFGACMTPNDQFLFVGNFDDANVSVIRTATHTVEAQIPVQTNPNLLAASPNGAYVLVTNYGSNTVSKIDVATLSVVATFAVDNGPQGIAISPDSSMAVVCNSNTNTVSIIDITTETVYTVTVGNAPCGVSITPDNGIPGIAKRALVTNLSDGTVSFIDLSTLTVIATLSVGENPIIAALSPDGSLATVMNDASNPNDASVMIIDVANPQILETFPYPDPEGVAIAPDGLQFMFGGDTANGYPNYVQLGSLVPPYPLLGYSVPLGSDVLVILPDQAPLARYEATIKNKTVTFDASESLSPTGAIAQFIWDFGDGSSLITTNSVVEHVYKKRGNFSATLRVVNSAGTSVDKVYNYQSSPEWNSDELIGSTLFRSGGLSATTTHQIETIAPKVSKIVPDHAKAKDKVKILGKGFATTTEVKFGNKEAEILSVSDHQILVVVPKQKKWVKNVHVTVTTPLGTSKKTTNALFKYVQGHHNPCCRSGYSSKSSH
ncbi:MAG: IPT/TIG domain-containing protein [Parachlamydiaceae bacterium]